MFMRRALSPPLLRQLLIDIPQGTKNGCHGDFLYFLFIIIIIFYFNIIFGGVGVSLKQYCATKGEYACQNVCF